MNSFKLFLCLMVTIIVLLPISVYASESKLSMEIWNRWTEKMVDGEVEQNEFALKRGYFRLEHKFTDKIKSRFNIDIFSDDEVSSGAGIKLKYGYLEFKELIPISDSKVYAGLVKNYFGTIYDWSYQTIEKDPSDLYKFISSTDYGLAFYGLLPQGFGEYSLSLVNGEGYKKTGDKINTHMGFLGNIRITPVSGLTLGGSILKNSKYEEDEVDDDGEKIRKDWLSIAGVVQFKKGQVSLLGEFLTSTTSYEADKDDITNQVIMGMGIFALKDYIPVDTDLVVRFDKYDPNTDVDDDGSNTLIAGINYNIKRNSKGSPIIMTQLNYQNISYENDDIDAVTKIMLQLRWKFSNKIK